MLDVLRLYNYLVQIWKQLRSMKNVSISEFRANLLKYLTQVQQGECITVTSKGHVLATLSPPVAQQSAALKKLRKLSKTAWIHDVIAPIGESWDSMQ